MTEVRIDKFKGTDIFAVWETDKEAEYPVISFGLKKAKVIVDHYDDLLQFIRTQEALATTNITKSTGMEAKTKVSTPKKTPTPKKKATPKKAPIIK
jgi:hypothetical protein